METIENLILDFGGVLLDLDERATYEAFVALGLEKVPPELTAVNLDFQRGKVGREQYVAFLKRYLPPGTTTAQVEDAWCAMLRQVPPARWHLLVRLGKRYRLFLLSNTDPIHIDRLRRRMDLDAFEQLFERVYYSQDTGLRKPERALFERVLRENGLDAARTLFVDDTLENVEGARAAGLQGLWLDLSRRRPDEVLAALAQGNVLP
ncbi:MAG TPA: HAD family phosphatase [Candidatus Merdimorpha stercoravium]|uniref:HAD family phosphatase n=1 Tax=Candidatus Merdimorpha stercoravium TaxID=2840863 RepID=A0A9D1H9A8_9FLAO|nr:HAD family phosphatase [Candidatus Merdimorpha stercoravium]